MWKRFQRALFPPSFPGVEEDPNPTIFNWARNHRTWIYLAGFLVFSIIIHGAGFYLFQVVYPSPSRETPRADTIAVMDPANPDVRSLLQRVEDRMSFLLPPSRESEVRISIDELPVRFSPSFQAVEMELAEATYSWTLPSPTDSMSGTFLPPVEGFESPILMTVQGELLHRELAPWSILEDYLSLAEQLPPIRLNLLVDPDGMVSVESVESDLDQSAEDEIKQVVESTLRYLPYDRETSGSLSIRTKG